MNQKILSDYALLHELERRLKERPSLESDESSIVIFGASRELSTDIQRISVSCEPFTIKIANVEFDAVARSFEHGTVNTGLGALRLAFRLYLKP